MKTLKTTIKELALTQKDLKNQRKTISLIGERLITPSEATYKHSSNRIKLREMNVAIGLLRNLTIEQIESRAKSLVNMTNVNKLIKQYEHEFGTGNEMDNRLSNTEDTRAINTGDSNG